MSQAPVKYLESTEFEAANYKWILVIYPNGNEDDDAADHISLYLKLIDQLGPGHSVNAAIKFCIYDYKKNTYLIIQSLAEHRYDVMEEQKGIARALPLSDFTSSSHGFIKGDRCTFGVEVFVPGPTASKAICSNVRNWPIEGLHTNSEFIWVIERFPKKTVYICSDEFDQGERKWKLQIFPRGLQKKGYLSLCLAVVRFSDLTNGKKLYVEQELRVKNLRNGEDEDAVWTGRSWYTASKNSWGRNDFLSLSDLHNENKGFKVDGKVIVQVKLNLLMLVHDN